MSHPRRITSRDNPLFREACDLAHSARERRRTGRSVLEGIHLCEAYALRFGAPQNVLVSDSAESHPQVIELLRSQPVEPVRMTDELFSQMSTLGQGVGLAFLIQTPRPEMPARFEGDAVYLDRIQDPGNVGTLLRTTAAAGIATVITAPGTAWCWSPKVLRAGMGAHFHLAIHESVSWETVRDRLDALIIGTRLQEASSVFDSDLRGASVWLFGSEGEGVSSAIAPDVGRWLRIPQVDSVESLNVAAAAAICLFEQRRQRSLK
jgi:TrmH family RNA methyltransferase